MDAAASVVGGFAGADVEPGTGVPIVEGGGGGGSLGPAGAGVVDAG
jgi:hypothetical protein